MCLILTLCSAFWVSTRVLYVYITGVNVTGVCFKSKILTLLSLLYFFPPPLSSPLQWHKAGLALLFCILQFFAMAWWVISSLHTPLSVAPDTSGWIVSGFWHGVWWKVNFLLVNPLHSRQCVSEELTFSHFLVSNTTSQQRLWRQSAGLHF